MQPSGDERQRQRNAHVSESSENENGASFKYPNAVTDANKRHQDKKQAVMTGARSPQTAQINRAPQQNTLGQNDDITKN